MNGFFTVGAQHAAPLWVEHARPLKRKGRFNVGAGYVPLLLIIFFFTFSSFHAAIKNAGSSFLALQIPPDARSAGMAEAGTAIADDVSAIYWNPAGLGGLKGLEIGLSGNSYFDTLNIGNLLFGLPLGGAGVIGVRLNFLSSGVITTRFLGEDTGKASATHLSGSISYGKELSKKFLIGGGVNFALESHPLDGSTKESANSISFDLGFLSRGLVKNFSLGIKVRNLGTKGSFGDVKGKTPINAGIGVAYQLKLGSQAKSRHVLNLSGDFDYVNGIDPLYRVGIEWIKGFGYDLEYALRTGFRGLSQEGVPVSAGVGVGYKNFFIDYAFLSFGELGATHRVSLMFKSFGIGGGKENTSEEPAAEKGVPKEELIKEETLE